MAHSVTARSSGEVVCSTVMDQLFQYFAMPFKNMRSKTISEIVEINFVSAAELVTWTATQT